MMNWFNWAAITCSLTICICLKKNPTPMNFALQNRVYLYIMSIAIQYVSLVRLSRHRVPFACRIIVLPHSREVEKYYVYTQQHCKKGEINFARYHVSTCIYIAYTICGEIRHTVYCNNKLLFRIIFNFDGV